jgi:steroid 5-alpha reductase family enzyme
MSAVLLAAALVPAGMMLVLWAASLRLRDVSIVDVSWGPGFAAVAWTAVAVAGVSPRGLLAATLATVWGLRLGIHLGLRRRGHGEAAATPRCAVPAARASPPRAWSRSSSCRPRSCG